MLFHHTLKREPWLIVYASYLLALPVIYKLEFAVWYITQELFENNNFLSEIYRLWILENENGKNMWNIYDIAWSL